MDLLREFVEHGGAYVGFCAGAFFTDTFIDDDHKVPGLHIIPVETADYDGNKGDDGTIVSIIWHGQKRDVFFNGGAYFKVAPRAPVEILSRYTTGEVASIEAQFGAGRVAISGFHPEATDDWKKFAVGVDHDGPDFDIADEMVRLAMGWEHHHHRRHRHW
jgi:glutamine amidotransferase-like uncharacterized protein